MFAKDSELSEGAGACGHIALCNAAIRSNCAGNYFVRASGNDASQENEVTNGLYGNIVAPGRGWRGQSDAMFCKSRFRPICHVNALLD